jgi:hypothetical protein
VLTAIILRDDELASLSRHEVFALEHILHERLSAVARARRNNDSALLLAIKAADYLAPLLDELGDRRADRVIKGVASSSLGTLALERAMTLAAPGGESQNQVDETIREYSDELGSGDDLLESQAIRQNDTVTSVGIFGFDGEPLAVEDPARQEVVNHVRDVSERLLDQIARDPDGLHKLTGHAFELVVAELLSRQGYEISVAPPGPDGGVDIFAARRPELGSFLYLVQCKRWKPTAPVGLAVVQRLYGRVEADKATAGVVVTTSRFTSPALEFADSVKYRMSLRDFDDLTVWVQSCKA